MIDFLQAKLQQLVVHKIGNKSLDEDCQYGKQVQQVNNTEMLEILKKYFLSPFKSEELHNFYYENDLKLNEIYCLCSEIFDDKELLYESSIKLAKRLYENSDHPKIKAGEFYVATFDDIIVNGEATQAVGLFKSENKEKFLKIERNNGDNNLNVDEGININKLDKGCLVYNLAKEEGFLVSIIDNVSKGGEAIYWKDNFLGVRARFDNYQHTKNILNLTKQFVVDKLPTEFNISKADQVDLLNKSVKFFKENESFDLSNFAEDVIQQPEVIKSFNNFKKQYQEENEVKIIDEFNISEQALKKQQRVFKSIIKLDKNFHIYVHGNREMIEKGYDEATGMHFYRLYFKEEN